MEHYISYPRRRSTFFTMRMSSQVAGRQHAKLAGIAATNQPLYRAYLLKGQFRQIFAVGGEESDELLDEWLARASRSKLAPFVDLARRIRIHFRRDIIHTLTTGSATAASNQSTPRSDCSPGSRSASKRARPHRPRPPHLPGYDTLLPGRT